MTTDALSARKSSFERGLGFLTAGDARMAGQIARNALEQFPDDGNLLCLLGAALVRQRRPADAETPLRRAVSLYPDFARAHEELGTLLLVLNRPEEALEHLRSAAELEPESGATLMKLGKALAALGRGAEADEVLERAFKLTPHRFDLAQAAELYSKGQREQAETICRRVLKRDPYNVDALRFLAEIAVKHQQWGDAEALLERAVEVAPAFMPAWHALIETYKEQDKYDQTLAACDTVLRRDPDNPNIRCERANVLALAGRHEEAIADYRSTLAVAPRHAGALSGLGHVLKTVGQTEDAVAAYRDCIAAYPNFGEAWFSLANLKTFRFEPVEVEQMERQLAGEGLGEEAQVHFHFALAKAKEDSGDYPTAFHHYEQGNGIRRMAESYDPVHTEVMHERIIETFSPEFFEARKGWGHPGDEPILIVGLPRSGSTLLEQILASHSRVEGTFELPELPRVIRSVNQSRADGSVYPEAAASLSEEEAAAFGREYLERTLKHRSGAPRFTDKLPNNFPNVGLLHLILPNARVVNARRHPLDSCLGTYKQLFAKGQSFSYDLIELGEYYLQYQRMIDHWDKVLPGKVLDVLYEDLVDDQEGQTRRLLVHCGLEWEDQCMRFYESDRAVRTASSEQVRRPIYADSVNLWRRYEAQLEPLIEVLEPLLLQLPPEQRPRAMQSG